MRKLLLSIALALALAPIFSESSPIPSTPPVSSPMLTLTEAEYKSLVHDAVVKAVNIALADYAKKKEAELRFWKRTATGAVIITAGALLYAAVK